MCARERDSGRRKSEMAKKRRGLIFRFRASEKNGNKNRRRRNERKKKQKIKMSGRIYSCVTFFLLLSSRVQPTQLVEAWGLVVCILDSQFLAACAQVMQKGVGWGRPSLRRAALLRYNRKEELERHMVGVDVCVVEKRRVWYEPQKPYDNVGARRP